MWIWQRMETVSFTGLETHEKITQTVAGNEIPDKNNPKPTVEMVEPNDEGTLPYMNYN